MVSVFLLLGTNLGNRQLHLQQAIEHVRQQISEVINASAVYETQSWGKTDEPDYLNQVIQLETDLPARNVLEKILTIELQMGRTREVKWGSRIIDIDILFYGNEVIDEPGLVVPHPQLHNRRFTLEPLAELAPDMLHPVLNKNILVLKNELKDSLIVKKLYF
ncbi:2-amino-4-hydroxy-6-hydroxymethyldihydropteridine diphosphokinase [Mucilaginibacter psychrotolerans]|uniref:2-amino-4-hydroxy-6-hydroxymethyldihydropteridine pyrophosphokinase n=1 Tax=Mucilaginibacter psychrotolerans TaxID=1524096 RepID=A0A4Y8SAQ1_9SPHI|nr:2-amino-4-hydroxy-6-hydroxymethyldihydropteridine diphosphokinase [Mucilaginibacter psychrotolerans]TFF35962.1 2-amino-4-hydroxy-6-hydroxymethyldihydropteridine diphosphokinase [Mucilaginibacter psychrotolerans]